MNIQWLSINDIKLLVKGGFYRLETGAKKNDTLIYDRQKGTYVGHLENQGTSNEYYKQDGSYQPPVYILQALETFNNSNSNWNKDGRGW